MALVAVFSGKIFQGVGSSHPSFEALPSLWTPHFIGTGLLGYMQGCFSAFMAHYLFASGCQERKTLCKKATEIVFM